MSKKLLDESGENRAVRAFLILYGGQSGLSVEVMKKHLTMCGYPHWPDWADKEPTSAHLNKASAQDWLRHLFGLEEELKVSTDGSTLVNKSWSYTKITPDNLPPPGVKMLLINKNLGSATLSAYHENSQFTHYAGLPKFKED